MIQETALKTADVRLLPNGKVAVCVDWEQFSHTVRGTEEKWWRCHRVDIDRGDLYSDGDTTFSPDKLYEAVVRERYSQSDIEAMQSNYEASVNGVGEKEEDAEQEYLDFLTWRAATKATVKANVKAWLDENPLPKGEE